VWLQCKQLHIEKPHSSSKSPQTKTTSSKSLNQSTEEVSIGKDDTNGSTTHHHTILVSPFVLIGVSAVNNMKQLEYLVRLHVMIAMVYSEGCEESLQNLLASLAYVMLIWKVAILLTLWTQLIVNNSFLESLHHHS